MPLPIRIIVYPAFFVFSLILFILILFPFESVRMRTAAEFEKMLGGVYEIKIEGMSPAPLTGIYLKNLSMRPKSNPDALPFNIKKAKVKIAIAPLFSGVLEIDYELIADKGSAKGEYSLKRGGYDMKIKMDQFDLTLFSAFAAQSGINFTGMTNGDVTLSVDNEDPLRNSGRINLQFPELVFTGMSTSDGSFRVPSIKLAQLGGPGSKFETNISKGNIDLDALNFAGGDLELQADGKIYGAKKWDNYRFNLKGAFKVTKEISDQFPLLALVDKQKQADGTLPLTITGRVTCPNIRIGEFKVPLGCTP